MNKNLQITLSFFLWLSLSAVSAFGQKTTFDAGTEFFRFHSDWVEFRKKAKRKIADYNSTLREKHSIFLKQNKTGILQLLDSSNCTSEIKIYPSIKYKQFEQLLEECPQNIIVGGASSYSFRINDYSNIQNADIEIKDGLIFSRGLLNQTLLIDLGDIDIQKISLQSKELNCLTTFSPAIIDKDIIKQSEQLRKGIRGEAFVCQDFAKSIQNHTYVLRSVAYRGKVTQTSQPDSNYKYNVLEKDTRKDIIIVFRIIELDFSKNIVVLWKKLDEKESSEIEFTK